jgi:hypothetical protein
MNAFLILTRQSASTRDGFALCDISDKLVLEKVYDAYPFPFSSVMEIFGNHYIVNRSTVMFFNRFNNPVIIKRLFELWG